MSTSGRVVDESGRLFAERAAARASGIVTISNGRLRRLFCLERGRLVFAASNLIEEQFDEVLVRERLLEPAHRTAAKVEASKQGVKLIAYLHEHKVVATNLLHEAFERHIGVLLEASLQDPDGEAAFAAGQADLTGELKADLGAAALVLRHAIRHPAEPDDLRVRIGPPDAKPRCAENVDQITAHLPIDEPTRRMLGLCDGSRTIVELIEQSSFDSDEAGLRALYGLVLLGAVSAKSAAQTADPSAPESVSRNEVLGRIRIAETADCYGVLGVDINADGPAIRDAYYYLARRYHPDLFRSGELQDLVLEMETYFAKVTEAYNTLINDDLRSAYDKERASGEKKTDTSSDSGTLARQNFIRAKALIAKKRFHDAVTSLENAVQLDGSTAEYHVELGVLLGRNPRRRDEAEQHLLRGIELNPAAAGPYFSLGELYVRMDRGDDAVRMFEEVLRWEPGHIAAREQLDRLSGAPRRRGGIFGG